MRNRRSNLVTKPRPARVHPARGGRARRGRKTYTAPSPQSTPLTSFTRLRISCRRFPAHCSAHVTVCCENLDLRSSTVKARSPSPFGTTFEAVGIESDLIVTLCVDASMCCIGPWFRSYACGLEKSWSLDGVRKLIALLVSHVRCVCRRRVLIPVFRGVFSTYLWTKCGVSGSLLMGFSTVPSSSEPIFSGRRWDAYTDVGLWDRYASRSRALVCGRWPPGMQAVSHFRNGISISTVEMHLSPRLNLTS